MELMTLEFDGISCQSRVFVLLERSELSRRLKSWFWRDGVFIYKNVSFLQRLRVTSFFSYRRIEMMDRRQRLATELCWILRIIYQNSTQTKSFRSKLDWKESRLLKVVLVMTKSGYYTYLNCRKNVLMKTEVILEILNVAIACWLIRIGTLNIF